MNSFQLLIIIFCVYFILLDSYYKCLSDILRYSSKLYVSSYIKNDKAVMDNLIIDDITKTRVKIAGDRFMIPGDFIVHEKYGIGKYIGIKLVNISPNQNAPTLVDAVVIKYKDSEVTWFKRLIENEIWIYRAGQSVSDDYELNSILDLRKWNKRKENIEATSKNMAMNLINLMAIRNSIHRTPCIPDDEDYFAFERNFSFVPTSDQILCFQQVALDMIDTTRPMDRLICGDVGFGKTEVAMRAIYRAVKSNKQVALLAPTRVLARQHERTLTTRMPNVNIQLLRGGIKNDVARSIKSDLKKGIIRVIIGTHALLQDTVEFDNLGLLIIDEEQRFGVNQKEKLKSIAAGTDVLTLTATPIPRTLQLSLSGLRDFSAMRTPPSNRKEVIVYVGRDGGKVESMQTNTIAYHIPTITDSSSSSSSSNTNTDTNIVIGMNDHTLSSDEIIKNAIIHEINRDGQVFVVVPFIKDIAEIITRLQDMKISGLNIIEAHGQCIDLEDRVDAFLKKEASVLVATTVIENGIDMPNVNTIIVFSADRFGISSLYQLKGRVGRSNRQAYAYFLTKNDSVTIEAEYRLTYLKTFTALGSGYDLSRRDMEMRGHGTIFGSEQSGIYDIGLDLQAKILATSLEEIKKEMILSIPECRVEIHDEIERFGRYYNMQLPYLSTIIVSGDTTNTTVDMNEISRWEVKVMEEVILFILANSNNNTTSSSNYSSNNNKDNNINNSNILLKSKIKPKSSMENKTKLNNNNHTNTVITINNDSKILISKKVMKSFISATTINEVVEAIDNLKNYTNNVPTELLSSLEYRCRLRISLRTIGIIEIKYIPRRPSNNISNITTATTENSNSNNNNNSNNNDNDNNNNKDEGNIDYIMRAPYLTLTKWERLFKRLPNDVSDKLEYRSVMVNNTQSGALRLKYRNNNINCGDSNKYYLHSKQVLLETLELCAAEVKSLLNEIIQLSD